MKFFAMDSPLMIALGKLADIVICNIMFCLFSIPIITIGASMAALYACMQQLLTDTEQDEGLIFRDFWRAFRKNFKQSTLIWLMCLVVIVFFVLYYFVTQSMSGPAGRVYQVTFYLLLFVFLFGFQYVYPLQARFQNKIWNTIRNAWLLSIAALPWSILALAIAGLAVFLTFYMMGGNMTVFLWAVCGFGLVAYLNSFLYRRAFRKISPEQVKQVPERSEEAIFTDENRWEDDLMVSDSRYSDPDWNRREDLFGPADPEREKDKQRK